MIVGALATLTMPGRWKLVGAVSAAIVTIVIVATLLPIAIETLA